MQFEYQAKTITQFSEIQELADSYSSQTSVYFRGQQKNWPLLPSIAREQTKSSLRESERYMFLKFKEQACKIMGKKSPNNDMNWLAVAQHYGLPTRLIDWSQDPFVAFWFAVRKPAINNKEPGVFWVLTPDSVDIIDDLDMRRPFHGFRTKVFVPNNEIIDERITKQKGAFTVHKYMVKEARFVALEKNRLLKPKLQKFFINPNSFLVLRNDLQAIKKIDDYALFPDLEGLARKLVIEYGFEHKESHK